MKDIWIFNHYMVPPEIEKGNRHNKFAAYLTEKGYNVTLFFSSAIHNSDRNLITDGSSYDVSKTSQGNYVALRTRSYTGNGKQRILNMLDYFWGLLHHTKAFAKGEKPDVIYASSVHPLTCVAGILIAKRYSIPCVAEIRDLWPLTLVETGKIRDSQLITKILYRLEHWIYKRADGLIFTMAGGAQYIKDRGWDKDVNLEKVVNINNGVDLELFCRQIADNAFQDEDLDNNNIRRVVYTGSIREMNQVDQIVEMGKILMTRKGAENIHILIYGDGDRRAALEDKCKRENISNIKFKGRVSREVIPYVLSKADVLLLILPDKPGLYKYGVSLNKLFEYLASGKPIVENINPNYNIVEEYDCGIVYDNGSPGDIADAVLRLIQIERNNPDDYNRICNNSRAAAKAFDINVLGKKLEDCLKASNNRKGGNEHKNLSHQYSASKYR